MPNQCNTTQLPSNELVEGHALTSLRHGVLFLLLCSIKEGSDQIRADLTAGTGTGTCQWTEEH
ncbi:hypothetical protein TYRP_018612 [Tyrophagus putrescentiae]|nr:hypothetical protein TYRP_018612 [Tyrophagus putrescentiae]